MDTTLQFLISVPPSLLFFQKFSNPPSLSRFAHLLSFLLCESNLQAICRKKYLLSKKVIFLKQV